MKQIVRRTVLFALCLSMALAPAAWSWAESGAQGETEIIDAYLNDRLAQITPSPSPTATAKATAAATPEPTAAAAAKATAAATPESTAAATAKATAAATPEPTATAKATATATPAPTAAATPEPAATAAPSPTATPPVPEATPRTLQEGSHGNDVTALQEALTELSFFTSKIDGQFGYRTRAALRKYQQAKGLTDDGVLGAQTRASLLADGYEIPPYYKPVFPEGFERYLELGMAGMDVRAVQEKLIEKGYLTGKADHIYGKRTRAAVRAFQEDNGLRVDGIVGPETLFLLMD